MEILGRPGDEVFVKVKIYGIRVTSDGTYYDLELGDTFLTDIPEEMVSEISEPEKAQKEPKNAQKEPKNAQKEPKNAQKEPENAQKEPKRRGRPRKATVGDLMKAAEKKRKPDPLTDVPEKIVN